MITWTKTFRLIKIFSCPQAHYNRAAFPLSHEGLVKPEHYCQFVRPCSFFFFSLFFFNFKANIKSWEHKMFLKSIFFKKWWMLVLHWLTCSSNHCTLT